MLMSGGRVGGGCCIRQSVVVFLRLTPPETKKKQDAQWVIRSTCNPRRSLKDVRWLCLLPGEAAMKRNWIRHLPCQMNHKQHKDVSSASEHKLFGNPPRPEPFPPIAKAFLEWCDGPKQSSRETPVVAVLSHGRRHDDIEHTTVVSLPLLHQASVFCQSRIDCKEQSEMVSTCDLSKILLAATMFFLFASSYHWTDNTRLKRHDMWRNSPKQVQRRQQF